MKKRQFITIRSEGSIEEVDLEIPADRPFADLMPDLLKVLNWPVSAGSRPIHYGLKSEAGDQITLDKSAQQVGLDNFEVLWISIDEQSLPDDILHNFEDMQSKQGEASPHVEDLILFPKTRRGGLPAPLRVNIPIEQPSLLSENGMIFVLGQPPIQIGRRSGSYQPAIDLSELDTNLISSRRHVEINIINGQYYLQPHTTKNGTLVNGQIINPGEAIALKDGDTIQFGFRGVELVFRTNN